MRKMLMLLATAGGVALFAGTGALAATVTTDFESFSLGSVDGQGGWRSGPNVDEAVLQSGGIPTFGLQSLRLSNLTHTGSFTGTQTYSTPVVPPAGENQRNTVLIAKFSVFDPTYQPGLQVTVSPDSGEGSRMAWVGLVDTSAGIHVTTSDSSGVDGDFIDTDLGLLSHGQPHTIEFRIKLIPGPANDVVRILIDGQDVGQCFTTWEEYYRHSSEQAPPPNLNKPPSINSLQFRVSQPGFTGVDAGYLFDNVTVTTGTGPASSDCDVTIDKEADAPTVTAGGRAGYRITVRNRGDVVARNLQACDRVPRGMTFVRADRSLRRIGRKRCLVIPSLAPGQRSSVHLTLQVAADTPQGRIANLADVETLGSLAPPPSSELPLGSTAAPKGTVRTIVRAARAVVRVRARRAGRPGVTG
jgi:uncharacterized repeat protein (TIGR01451 family)